MSVSPRIRIAILEDHLSTADGYRLRLGALPEMEIVGHLAFGEELEPFLARCPTDVLILDVNVPTGSENPAPYPLLHTIPALLQKWPRLEILVISMITERAMIEAVLEAGASGYLLKDDRSAIEQLASIVKSVAGGGIYLSEHAGTRLRKHRQAEGEVKLTRRQSEALSLCAAYPDLTTADLAERMGVTNSTVRNLLSGAYLRLGVSSRAAAIDQGRRLGLITPPERFSRLQPSP
jgi:DNA-binding NarL/FixJ family response regulator